MKRAKNCLSKRVSYGRLYCLVCLAYNFSSERTKKGLKMMMLSKTLAFNHIVIDDNLEKNNKDSRVR